MLPLRELVVFPYMVLPIFVARERSIAAVEDALAGDRLLLLVTQRDGSLEEPSPDDLHAVGTVAMVMRILRMPDGRVKALVQGLAQARASSASWSTSLPAGSASRRCLPGSRPAEWSRRGGGADARRARLAWRSCCRSRTSRPKSSR